MALSAFQRRGVEELTLAQKTLLLRLAILSSYSSTAASGVTLLHSLCSSLVRTIVEQKALPQFCVAQDGIEASLLNLAKFLPHAALECASAVRTAPQSVEVGIETPSLEAPSIGAMAAAAAAEAFEFICGELQKRVRYYVTRSCLLAFRSRSFSGFTKSPSAFAELN